MKTRNCIQWTLALACILAQGSSWAVNLRWLDYSPVRFFNDRDWELARGAADDALDNGKDGATVSWENPETGHRGSLTPLDTRQRNGRTCRNLVIENHARGLSGRSEFLFCQQPGGDWKMEAQDDTRGGAPAEGEPEHSSE